MKSIIIQALMFLAVLVGMLLVFPPEKLDALVEEYIPDWQALLTSVGIAILIGLVIGFILRYFFIERPARLAKQKEQNVIE